MARRLRPRLLVLLALLYSASSSVGSSARAAFAPTILLVRAPSVSRANADLVAAALRPLGELVDPAEYLRASAARGLPATSERALHELAPSSHVRLVVVLTNMRGGLLVGFRDGRNLASIDRVIVAKQRARSAAIGDVRASAELALAQLEPSTSAAVGGGPEPMAADGGPEPIAAGGGGPEFSAAAPAQPPAPPIEPAPEREPIPDTPADVDDANTTEAPALETEPAAGSPPSAASSISAAISFGPGFGQRSVLVPARDGVRRLSTRLFPALDLRVAAESSLAPSFALGLRFEYQTSLGLHAYQTLPGRAEQRETSLRSHHLVFGIMPRYRFADSEQGVSLGLLLGWGFRGFDPVSATEWPPYTLDGPVIRPELRIAIGDVVALRLAPEAFVVTGVTSELRRLAAAGGVGFGVGGEVALDLAIARRVGLSMAYRESDVTLATGWGPKLRDRERFATATATMKY